MKAAHRTICFTGVLFATAIALVLPGLTGCTSYNPYTGMYEPDPGKTMMAVGSAALAGSIIYNETNRPTYRRPPNHYHYYAPPYRPGPPPPRRR